MSVNNELLKNFIGLKQAIDQNFISPLPPSLTLSPEQQTDQLLHIFYIFLFDPAHYETEGSMPELAIPLIRFATTWDKWKEGLEQLKMEDKQALTTHVRAQLKHMGKIFFKSKALNERGVGDTHYGQKEYGKADVLDKEQWQKATSGGVLNKKNMENLFKTYSPYGVPDALVDMRVEQNKTSEPTQS